MCISKKHLDRAQQIWPISNISLCTQRDTAFYRRQCLSLTLLLLNELNIICSIFVFVCCNVCHFGHILILDVLLGCIVSEKMENQKENSNRLDKEMPVCLLSFFLFLCWRWSPNVYCRTLFYIIESISHSISFESQFG